MNPTRRPLARSAAVIALTTAAVSLGPLSIAQAAPGDNGDVKVHESTTPVDDQRDEPKVCVFYLDAFNFDTVQQVSWTITPQPAHGSGPVSSGTLTLTNGSGNTGNMTLPNGQYKLDWTFTGENGEGKHKVFKVECPQNGPSSPVSPSSPASHQAHGGVPTGGGGTSEGPDTAELAAGSALLAVAAGFGIRGLRRRSARRAES